MRPNKPQFDGFSGSYDELLRDPLRDRFSPDGAAFFHERKRDLIRDFFRRRATGISALAWLDVGCGKGELLTLLGRDFARAAGCDPSAGMLAAGGLAAIGVETRVQEDPRKIPYEDARFDFVTAVCVYHHVPPASRVALTAEVRRVLKVGGVFALIEHNPFNPVTRLIVSRTPVDAGALLLRPSESRRLLRSSGFQVEEQRYFLYLPGSLYRRFGAIEALLARAPLGGQYALFGRLSGPES
jgi:SAM-dependent methyltransferase